MADTLFTRLMGRRQCLRTLLGAAGILGGSGLAARAQAKSMVVIVRTDDRVQGIRTAMARFDPARFRGARIALKANYNSADPFPASTHPDTLRTLVETLAEAGPASMTLAERSGMGDTAQVLRSLGVRSLTEELGVEVVVMDELDADGYVTCRPARSQWKRGFLLARPFAGADAVVQTCCLKTHQYGGHFTMALKNAVGAVAKHDPADGYNYMSELHRSPLQRSLIAEISLAFRNDLIVMDAMKAFVTGGPHAGREVSPGVIVAGTDPVAVDAVGVAILRMYPTTDAVMTGPVFAQEQIRRAAELGIGASSPENIELVPIGPGADGFARRVQEILAG
ncbi:DUF362 domain-containing protein [Pseudodesulfovibrio sp. F-1]|uniref:DUF362 domain-containing protein n=1 Tax=Pseudodesulfovibrio alkaliphilus TaxID=2661613 RepID=A0A7K1KMA6_9BACT|nr:DUF362 domain-containing protein [Pseudodesulfovibrio alkaliphilus]MUM77224.1 DUF362 domain-containing protein [Pseudodesulfovibrio alkaliphilus]